MNREEMIWILLLAGLTSSVCGIFVLKKTPTFYQAEEDVNVAIGWDSPIMSLTILRCFFHSEPLKLFYEMVNGVESSESQHQQFAGRVQCDKDALREGRVRLHVSRVTTDDSGRYWCDLAANYDKIRRRWGLETTEHFILNVTSDGDNSDVFLTTPKLPEGTTTGFMSSDPKHTTKGQKKRVKSHYLTKEKIVCGYILLGVTSVALLVGAVNEAVINKRRSEPDRCSFIELLRKTKTKKEFII